METKMMIRLESIRKDRKLTRADLEKLSGVSRETIKALEKGINNIDEVKLSTLVKLARALKVKVRDIVDKDIARKL